MKLILKSLLMITLIFALNACVTTDGNDGQLDVPETNDPHVHIHTPADAVRENEIPVACFTDGSYDSVIYCSSCNEELSREKVVVSATGHTPGEAVMENIIPASCLVDGSCISVTCCSKCGEELSREDSVIKATGHIPAEAVMENVIPPVCKNDGRCETVVRCSSCNFELSRTPDIVPAIGHKWVNDRCQNCNIAFSVEESLEFTLSDDGTFYIITGIGTFYGDELIMPSEYKGLPVKEIENYAFKNCDFVKRAVIPASITKLGYGAAQGCTGLEEIIIEDRRGWSLYDGQEDPKIFPIPAFLLINTKNYFDLLINGDQFALIKD